MKDKYFESFIQGLAFALGYFIFTEVLSTMKKAPPTNFSPFTLS